MKPSGRDSLCQIGSSTNAPSRAKKVHKERDKLAENEKLSRKLPAGARRPRNADKTRATILEMAKVRFETSGYEQVGVRDISADAGINAALIYRYFGSKEGLFSAVLGSITKDPMPLQPSTPDFGEQLARLVLRLASDKHSNPLAALELAMRATNSPTASQIVRADLEQRFIAPLCHRFGGGADAAARAHLCVAIIMGVGIVRGVLGKKALDDGLCEGMIPHLAPLLDILVHPIDSEN